MYLSKPNRSLTDKKIIKKSLILSVAYIGFEFMQKKFFFLNLDLNVQSNPLKLKHFYKSLCSDTTSLF